MLILKTFLNKVYVCLNAANLIIDTLCSGTPEGVGPVKPGQKITAGITNLIDFDFNVEQRKKP